MKKHIIPFISILIFLFVVLFFSIKPHESELVIRQSSPDSLEKQYTSLFCSVFSSQECFYAAITETVKNLPTPVSFFKNDIAPVERNEVKTTRTNMPDLDNKNMAGSVSESKTSEIKERSITGIKDRIEKQGLEIKGTQTLTFQIPEIPRGLSPSGNIKSTQPAFSWDKLESATEYRIRILDGSARSIWEKNIPGINHCGNHQCVFTSEIQLSAGDFAWQLKGLNIAGEGDWNEAMNFTIVSPPLPPGRAVPVSPSGSLSAGQATPIFAWAGVYEASGYRLLIQKMDGSPVFDQWMGSDEVCTGINCQVTPALSLAPGEYQWSMQTRNDGGNGPESKPLKFIINP